MHELQWTFQPRCHANGTKYQHQPKAPNNFGDNKHHVLATRFKFCILNLASFTQQSRQFPKQTDKVRRWELFSSENVCLCHFMAAYTENSGILQSYLWNLPWNIKRNSSEVTDKSEFVQFRGSNESSERCSKQSFSWYVGLVFCLIDSKFLSRKKYLVEWIIFLCHYSIKNKVQCFHSYRGFSVCDVMGVHHDHSLLVIYKTKTCLNPFPSFQQIRITVCMIFFYLWLCWDFKAIKVMYAWMYDTKIMEILKKCGKKYFINLFFIY